jgi:uncharacterized protein YbjT (DUF2867 family)
MNPRRIFVAGASGAVGSALVRLSGSDPSVIPYFRRAPGTSDSRAVSFALTDSASLAAALSGCTTIVQLIGTMRKRFASGDTYESSDVGTTRLLTDAGVKAGCDHLILLSAAGTGTAGGAYYRAKEKAERICRDSGIPWTIVRPSFLIGRDMGDSTAYFDPAMRLAARVMGRLGSGRYRPIEVRDLARAILHCARERDPVEEIVEGRSLFHLVSESARA